MSGLNRMEWRGQRGHYEVWYLTLQDAASGWAFWFRYTLSIPPGGEPGAGHLWAFSFPPSGNGAAGPALQLLDRYPIERLLDRSSGGLFALELGPGRLELGSGAGLAQGDVGNGERRITWNLKVDDLDARGFRHVPRSLYRLGVASTGVASPGLCFRVSGTVTVGGTTVELKKALGEQGHVFGRRHANRWAWAHCHEFEGAPGVIFEGVSAQVKKAGVLLPAASPLCLRLGPGRRLTWNKPRNLWKSDSFFALGSWSFEARKKNCFVRGNISAPPESFVSVEYRDPDGRRVYCNHTESADVTLDVFERRGRSWDLAQRLESKGKTAFEYGEEQRDPRPQRRLDQAEARPA